jgi:hypothetical protein
MNYQMESIESKVNRYLASKSKSWLYKQNVQWFMDHYVTPTKPVKEIHNTDELQFGRIYTFLYKPKYRDKLSFYDNFPMNLILGHIETKQGTRNPFGINLSFIPPKTRLAILDRLWRVFNDEIVENRKLVSDTKTLFNHKVLTPIPITYETAKILLKDSGFEFAIRSYIYEGGYMYTIPKVVDYDSWWRLSMFPSQFITGMNIMAIYYRYKLSLDPSYRIGTKEKKVILSKLSKDDLDTVFGR